MISLGIDASVRSTGITVITPDKILVKRIHIKKLTGGKLLVEIEKQFKEFIGNILPEIVVMEGPSFMSTNKPFSMGEAYGIYKFLSFSLFQKEPVIVSPKELKKYIASNGSATKTQVIEKCTLLGCPSTQEDICDSYAAALLGKDILSLSNSPGTRKALEVRDKFKL